MCAISGTLGLAEHAVAEAMNRAMAHRGPDGEGVFVDRERAAALAHRRLAIIDPGPGGRQPMATPDGRYRLVFNGEIYNYRELRARLQAEGWRFATEGDSEVLLAAYARWGAACLERLDGMFAFAILDREARTPGGARLFLARDRLGIKPLYYTRCDGVFLFASELKGLLASARVPRRVDAGAVWHYLSLGSVPQPGCILDGVHMLRAGHCMEVSAGLEMRERRWWDLARAAPWQDPAVQRLGAAAAAERTRELLEQATRRHLVADVEVGAFLSGGIDSTAVVGLMSRQAQRRIKTFSLGVADEAPGGGELAHARAAARRFDTEHREVIVRGEQVAADFDRLIEALDQPSVDGTNTWLVARAAAEQVKVVLSGVGGDELFAGYAHFGVLQRAARWGRWLPPRLAHPLARVLARMPRAGVPDPALLAVPRAARYLTLRNLCGVGGAAALAGPGLAARPAGGDLAAVYAPWLRADMDPVRETSRLELGTYLVNTLLRDVDATAMVSGLEVRPVLLDHHLAEFVFALPSRLKLDTAVNKPALVRAVCDLLPGALARRPKAGFELPLRRWLAGPLRERARAAFDGEQARAVFSAAFLARTRGELARGECASMGTWGHVVLLEWMRASRCELAA